MKNILLVTQGTGGDVKPFIKIGRMLKSGGYSVSILTHCIYEDEIKNAELNFVAIDNYEQYIARSKSLDNLSDAITQRRKYIHFNKKYCGADKLQEEFEIINKICDKKNTIIIFRHRFCLAALLFAEKYKIPAISVFLAPNYIQHLELHEQLIGNIMIEEINWVRKKINLKEIDNWTKWMCSPKLKIALWPKWYAIDEVNSVDGMVAIGFPEFQSNSQRINQNMDKKIKVFLKSEKKLALITAGTSNAINPKFYEIAIEACEYAQINTLVVTTFDEFIPKYLANNIVRVKEAPIKDILPFVDVVIHHGGIGTSGEALNSGIPQVIMAHLADRPDNANRFKNIGVASVFPEIQWNSRLIGKRLLEIISDNQMRNRCKEKSIETNQDINIELNLIIKDIFNDKSKYEISKKYENLSGIYFKQDKDKDKDKENKRIVNEQEEKKKTMIRELLKRKNKFNKIRENKNG